MAADRQISKSSSNWKARPQVVADASAFIAPISVDGYLRPGRHDARPVPLAPDGAPDAR
jgi:hypothetical protein